VLPRSKWSRFAGVDNVPNEVEAVFFSRVNVISENFLFEVARD